MPSTENSPHTRDLSPPKDPQKSPENQKKKLKIDSSSESSDNKVKQVKDADKSSERYKKHRRHRRSQSKERRSRSPPADREPRKRRYVDLDKPDDDYPRYYGEDSNRNNDKYWSKYPRKDEHVVGARYYEPSVKQPEQKQMEDPVRQRKQVDLITSKTGGAYIPPAKLRLMQAEITDKTSAAYQRIAWEALKKSVHGYINKINTSTIGIIARELLHENIVRGRGLLCKSIIQAQAASPTFTSVYSALVAVINSKFPNIGELLLKRLVIQFKRGFKQNNKVLCISAASFIAHLVNQRVAHEIVSLEILTLLVESPTDDSVEVAISFLKECGQKLTEVSSKGINAIFEMLRNILHEGQLEKRIQYMIEVIFQIRKDGFKDHPAIVEDLDVVEEEDQITHLITLDDVDIQSSEDILNVFKFDDNYEVNEGKYKTLSKEILGSDSDSDSGSDEDDSSDNENEEEDEEGKEAAPGAMIIDNTETNLITLRRTIYLTIQSSLDFEECAHKLLKMELKPGQEIELCHMFLDCCAEQRTYEKFYGLLAQRFCQINTTYVAPFEQIFKDTYSTTHRLDANRLRNVSKFFAHLLFTDAIGWEVLEIMKLNEEDTTSSSRIFIKILFQELAEYMGLANLNKRLKDPTFQAPFSGLFPRDNPKNTRFAINFFTSIGLGGLTDELREHLKSIPKQTVSSTVQESSSSSVESSSSSESSEESSSEDSSDSSESSEDEKKKSKTKGKHSPKAKPKRSKEDSNKSREEDKKNKEVEKISSEKDKYEKAKSKHEDNIEQLRSQKKSYEHSKRPQRSRSNDRRNRDFSKDRRPGNDDRQRFRRRS